MFARQVRLARRVAKWIEDSEGLELLPRVEKARDFSSIHIIVPFRARDKEVNESLAERINASKVMFVSGTSWDEQPAVRIAVSTWKLDVERDFEIIKGVLEQAVASR